MVWTYWSSAGHWKTPAVFHSRQIDWFSRYFFIHQFNSFQVFQYILLFLLRSRADWLILWAVPGLCHPQLVPGTFPNHAGLWELPRRGNYRCNATGWPWWRSHWSGRSLAFNMKGTKPRKILGFVCNCVKSQEHDYEHFITCHLYYIFIKDFAPVNPPRSTAPTAPTAVLPGLGSRFCTIRRCPSPVPAFPWWPFSCHEVVGQHVGMARMEDMNSLW